MKEDKFFLFAKHIETMTNDDIHAVADGLLQEYDPSFLASGSSNQKVSQMAEAIKKFASGVMEAEDFYK